MAWLDILMALAALMRPFVIAWLIVNRGHGHDQRNSRRRYRSGPC